MSALPRHRELDWKLALEEVNRKARQGEVKYLDMEIDLNPSSWLTCDTSYHKIASGSVVINNFIKESGFVRCKKSEATLCITVGEKFNGCWIAKKHKNYWLR